MSILFELVWLFFLLLNQLLGGICPCPSKYRVILRSKRWQHAFKVKKLWASLGKQPVVFFHVASAGEFEQVRFLIHILKKEQPGFKIVVSYFSPSAQALIEKQSDVDVSYLAPAELSWVQNWIWGSAVIQSLIFVRYDIWPGLVRAARKKKIPLVLLAATFWRPSKPSFVSRIYTHIFLKPLLLKFQYIFPVDEESYQAFTHWLGAPSIQKPTGHLKWAAAFARREHQSSIWAREKAFLEPFREFCSHLSPPLVLVASPHEEEIQAVIEALKRKQGPLFLVWHDPEDQKKWGSQLSRMFSVIHLSDTFRLDGEHIENLENTLIVCQVYGWLFEFYPFFQGVLVGGGFDGLLHNICEPAVHGLKIWIGPHHHRSPEVGDLLKTHQVSLLETPQKWSEELSIFKKRPMSQMWSIPFSPHRIHIIVQKLYQNWI